jgi:hypothetical protein
MKQNMKNKTKSLQHILRLFKNLEREIFYLLFLFKRKKPILEIKYLEVKLFSLVL